MPHSANILQFRRNAGQVIKLSFTVLIVTFGIISVQAAWTGPTATPPNENVDAPINVGTVDQIKNAGLSLNSLAVFGNSYIQNALGVRTVLPSSGGEQDLALDVEGAVGAQHYCDADGNNCVSALDISGGTSGSVPSGAVMPFNLSSCPSGWSPFADAGGRFIVGVGSADGQTYSHGQTGGEAFHQLTLDELPSFIGQWAWANLSGPYHKAWTYYNAAGYAKMFGNDEPHENRPPYLALLYCEKD